MTYFLGVVLLAAGMGMVIKTEWLIQNIGTNAWAEANIGSSGGSRLLYKFIGLAFIFVGFVLITNMQEGFLAATVGKVLIR